MPLPGGWPMVYSRVSPLAVTVSFRLRSLEAQLLELRGVEDPERARRAQRRELIEHLGRHVAAAHVARRVGRRRRRRSPTSPPAFFGSLGGGRRLGLLDQVHPDRVLAAVALALEVDRRGLVLEVHLAEVVLPGVDDGDLAGRALGLALPGQVSGDEAEGGQAPLQCCGFAGHDATPWLDELETVGAAAFLWLRRRRVTNRPSKTTSTGIRKIDE